MMTDHPITPPLKLVQRWTNEFYGTADVIAPGEFVIAVTNQAACWGADQQLKLDAEQIAQAYTAGADQELEACCAWLQERISEGWNPCHLEDLRNARRPKPPSLKEQALEQLRALDQHGALDCNTDKIRRALEALPK